MKAELVRAEVCLILLEGCYGSTPLIASITIISEEERYGYIALVRHQLSYQFSRLIPSLKFCPFGHGPRSCLGDDYSLVSVPSL